MDLCNYMMVHRYGKHKEKCYNKFKLRNVTINLHSLCNCIMVSIFGKRLLVNS